MSNEATERQELLAELGQSLRRMGIATVMFHRVIADRIGLNVTDSRAWSLLDDVGPMPAGRLAELTGLSPGAVTTIIDRLERKNFARRRTDPIDRRRVIVEPVRDEDRDRAAGRLFASLMPGVERMTSGYSDQEIALILEFIEKGTEFLREGTVRLREDESR